MSKTKRERARCAKCRRFVMVCGCCTSCDGRCVCYDTKE